MADVRDGDFRREGGGKNSGGGDKCPAFVPSDVLYVCVRGTFIEPITVSTPCRLVPITENRKTWSYQSPASIYVPLYRVTDKPMPADL